MKVNRTLLYDLNKTSCLYSIAPSHQRDRGIVRNIMAYATWFASIFFNALPLLFVVVQTKYTLELLYLSKWYSTIYDNLNKISCLYILSLHYIEDTEVAHNMVSDLVHIRLVNNVADLFG